MAILNPVTSKFTLTLNTPLEIYACPAGKSHAIVDVSFLKPAFTGSSLVSIAMTKETNPANLTSVDYFYDDIQLTDGINFAELNKVIVGPGERLIANVVSGDDINIRVSGVEEANPKVVAAGKLVATSIAGTAQAQLYANALPSVAYISGSLTVYNPSTTDNATFELWVTSQSTPSDSDKIIMSKITPQDTTILENVLLLPNEKLFVRSDLPNCEYFLVALVVGV